MPGGAFNFDAFCCGFDTYVYVAPFFGMGQLADSLHCGGLPGKRLWVTSCGPAADWQDVLT